MSGEGFRGGGLKYFHPVDFLVVFLLQWKGYTCLHAHQPGDLVLTWAGLCIDIIWSATNDYFHYPFICLLFSPLIIWSKKYSKIVKNAHHNFSDPKVITSNYLFCPLNSPKSKNV